MGNKRKHQPESKKYTKSLPVEVIIDNLKDNPLCLHGHTLLFTNEKTRYYACSLNRNKKECTLYITEEEWKKESVKERNKKYFELIPYYDKMASANMTIEIKSQHFTDRAYCVTCDELYIPSISKRHVKDHKVVSPLSDEQMLHPSSWLPALQNDSVEAQYIFSKKTINNILAIIKRNNIRNVLCIGTPSVHEAVTSDQSLNSILLDYDKRFRWFHAFNKFLWYNMFNNFFFNEGDKKILKAFLKSSSDSELSVVMDPPFGGRVEPLVATLQQLSDLYKKVCKKPDSKKLHVIWAFPYFSEPYICNMMPELQMHDFQVEYDNHIKFHNKKNGRKFGSPVRFFTNLPFKSIDLSHNNSYKFCDKCKYWVSISNRHCFKCGKCTSKNGMTYKHCNSCKICVKPTFIHCETCGRCCQQKDHQCNLTIDSQSCYNCKQKGHKSSDCPEGQATTGGNKKKNICLMVT